MSMEDSVSLKRLRDGQVAADQCRNDMELAKEIYKLRKEEHATSLRELQRVIRAETTEAPLFDRLAKEEVHPDGDEDAE